jgi:hypothetical protein
MGVGMKKDDILQMMAEMVGKLNSAESTLQGLLAGDREVLLTMQLNRMAEFEDHLTALESQGANSGDNTPVVLLYAEAPSLKLELGF